MQSLSQLLDGQSLDQTQANKLFTHLVKGELNEIQITAALIAMKARGETPAEMAGAAQALRVAAKPFQRPQRLVLDSCGTGGDGSNSINISTTAALVAASMGYCMAKHGNRSVSSRSGSADVLEALQLNVTQDPEVAAAQLAEFNFCFLFAPHYHPGIRYAMPVRQTLKTRTLFNVLGPLLNPARPDAQLLGVYAENWCQPMAETLQLIGCERALVVHGSGIDELALHGPTQVVELNGDKLAQYTLAPSDFGVPEAPLSELRGGDAQFNANALQALLAGQGTKAQQHAVAMNVAGLMYLADPDLSLPQATAQALEHLASGQAALHLQALQQAQTSMAGGAHG